MAKDIIEMKEDLQLMADSDSIEAHDAEKGLRFAKECPEIAHDIIRHYWYRANRERGRANYKGNVCTSAPDTDRLTEYDIVDVTSFDGERIEAKFIDATTIDADVIEADVIDATSVTYGSRFDVGVKDVTSVESKEERKQREKEQKERQRNREHEIAQKEKELREQGKDPYEMLEQAAQRLSDQYNRPPNSRGNLVSDGDTTPSVYVSNQPFPQSGNNMHSGPWGIIRYEKRRQQFEVMYKRDGVAGNPDEMQTFEAAETTANELVSAVTSFPIYRNH